MKYLSDILEEEFRVIHGRYPVGIPPPVKRSTQDSTDHTDNEKERLKAIHKASHKELRTALCLSGGGIRSATFCLGVLQALSRTGQKEKELEAKETSQKQTSTQLERFHYLSTVSGGGYIGSWLSAWIARVGMDQVMQKLPSSGSEEPHPIARLRAFSNYLAPRRGWSSDTWTLIALYGRNLLLNWSVLVPLVIAVLLMPRILLTTLHTMKTLDPNGIAGLAGAFFLAVCIFLVAICLPSAKDLKNVDHLRVPKIIPWVLALAAFPLTSAYYSILNPAPAEGLKWKLAGLVSVCAHYLAGIALIVCYRRSGYKWPAINLVMIGLVMSAVATGIVLWGGMALILPWAKALSRFGPTIISVPYVLLAYSFVGTVWIAVTTGMSNRTTETDREWWATSGGGAAAFAVIWVALHCVVFYGPSLILWLGSTGAIALAGAGGLAGAVTALGGYWGKRTLVPGDEHDKGILAALAKWGLQIGSLLFLVLGLGVGGSLLVGIGLQWQEYQKALQKESVAKQAIARYTEKREEFQKYVNEVAKDFPPDEIAKKSGEKKQEKSKPEDLKADAAQVLKQEAGEQLRRAGRTELAQAYSQLGQWLRDLELRLGIGRKLYKSGFPEADDPTRVPFVPWSQVVFLLLGLGITVVMSFLIGVNRFTLHSMYANRLTRAYLGASRQEKERNPEPLTSFDEGDDLPMSHLRGGKGIKQEEAPVRLFHIVNTALNLTNSGHLEWQQRKASSFTISPLHAGSWTLGYQDVATYGGGIKLGKAVGISGAAVSPNMGYHSSTLVTTVMTFFNARLGQWLPNPGPKGRKVWSESEPKRGLLPLLNETFGMTTDKTAWVNLSDGGHFDNLGLYEMVRRRCRRILLIDASADADYRYEDLTSTIQKIRNDMGISVEFPETSGPMQQRPPKRVYTVGWIRYPEEKESKKAAGQPNESKDEPSKDESKDGKRAIPLEEIFDGMDKSEVGVLVYVKPVLTGGEPADVQRYASDHRQGGDRFPHQSTQDQFFDEDQFESYRMLGEHMARLMMDEIKRINNDGEKTFESFTRVGPEAVMAQPAIASVVGSIVGVGGGSPEPNDGRMRVGEISDLRGITRLGIVGGTLGALQSWGTVTLVGTALTVGGILGVTGTVALQSDAKVSVADVPPLSFSPSAENMLKKGIPVTVTVTPDMDPQLKSRVENLSDALRQLAGVLGSGTEKNPELTGKIQKLGDAVARLTSMVSGGGTAPNLDDIRNQIKGLQGQIKALQDDLMKKPDARELAETKRNLEKLESAHQKLHDFVNTGLVETLKSVKGGLDNVKGAVDKVGPRRNAIDGREGAR